MQDLLEEYCSLPLSSRPYSEVELDPSPGGRELVVVVGGEAHGLSAAAKKLALDRLGERAFVPTRNGVDSLNVASAASVILFDIARRMDQAAKEQSRNAKLEEDRRGAV